MYHARVFHCIAMIMFICYIGGQEELLCSHEALHWAVENLTAFAKAEGNILYINHTECLHCAHTACYACKQEQSSVTVILNSYSNSEEKMIRKI